jgi:hypothetical protein
VIVHSSPLSAFVRNVESLKDLTLGQTWLEKCIIVEKRGRANTHPRQGVSEKVCLLQIETNIAARYRYSNPP